MTRQVTTPPRRRPLTPSFAHTLQLTELEQALPLVSHFLGKLPCSQLYIHLIGSVWDSLWSDSDLWLQPGGRHPHHLNVRRRILSRPAYLGTIVRESRPQACLSRCFAVLHRHERRMRAQPQHCLYPDLPLPQWRFWCLSFNQLRCSHC